MRGKLLGAAVAVAVLAPALAPVSAHAQEAAFCAEQGGRSGYRNCGYYTYAQCRASVSGVGGYCYANPAFRGGYNGGYGGAGGGGYNSGYSDDEGYEVAPQPRYYRRY